MADISQITLPSGTTYNIKDTVAREAISSGGTFTVAWNGSGAPTVANIPKDVTIVYEGTTYTGTLDPSENTLRKFYLVKSSTQQDPTLFDIYDEYITIDNGSGANPRYQWEKIGDTQIKLSEIVKGVTPVTSKLQTTAVRGVTGSTTASLVTRAEQTTATGETTASNDNSKILANISVSEEVLTIHAITLNTQTTGSTSAVSSVTVPVADSTTTTVATGNLDANGSGDSVMTNITVS